MATLSPDVEETILESVRRGTPVNTAALAAGVSPKTIQRWREVANGATVWPGSESPVDDAYRVTIVSFVQKLSRARAESLRVVTHHLWHNATTPNAKTGWYDTQALDKLASKNPDHHDDWFERRQVNVDHQGQVLHELKLVKALEPEAIEAAYQALDALPEAQA